MNHILALLLILGVLGSGAFAAAPKAKGKSATTVSVKKNAPPSIQGLKFQDIKGHEIALDTYKGKVVIVSFFATWCPPCLKEIPELISLQNDLGPKGVQVIGVSVDDTAKLLPMFALKLGINYPIVLKNGGAEAIFGSIESIPTVFLIDRKQHIVDKWSGYLGRDEINAKLKKWI